MTRGLRWDEDIVVVVERSVVVLAASDEVS